MYNLEQFTRNYEQYKNDVFVQSKSFFNKEEIHMLKNQNVDMRAIREENKIKKFANYLLNNFWFHLTINVFTLFALVGDNIQIIIFRK